MAFYGREPDDGYTYERSPKGYRVFRLPGLNTKLDASRLRWPTDRAGASGNFSYEDYSSTQWSDVDRVIEIESALLHQFESTRGNLVLADVGDEVDPVAYAQIGFPFDLGTCAATLALNAARCPTATSCAGHLAGFPDVTFWIRAGWVNLLVEAVRAAQIGIGNAAEGTAEVFCQADDLLGLVRFAGELRRRANYFAEIVSPQQERARRQDKEAEVAKQKRVEQRKARKKMRKGR